jgi:hypothetical protein
MAGFSLSLTLAVVSFFSAMSFSVTAVLLLIRLVSIAGSESNL